MKRICSLFVVLFCGLASSLFGQGLASVYHTIGPVMFTNAAAFGHADGTVAGTDYFCGVYAGADAASLQPQFGSPISGLKKTLNANGSALMSGSLQVGIPTGSPVLQFRVWPTQFSTYEAALNSQSPGVIAGVSSLFPAIPSGVIVEFPIATGPMWISPVPEPASASILTLAAFMFAGQSWLRKASR